MYHSLLTTSNYKTFLLFPVLTITNKAPMNIHVWKGGGKNGSLVEEKIVINNSIVEN